MQQKRTIKKTEWKPFESENSPDIAAVRIHFKKNPGGYHQRHEWKYKDGTTETEAWIPTSQYAAENSK